MSKKTKRLEKENHTLERQKTATNANVITMAEDRTKANKDLEMLRKKNANLEKLCRGMQQQGRGQLPSANVSRQGEEIDSEGTESEYDDEYEDEADDEEYDDDTEEDASFRQIPGGPPVAGPMPPPPPSTTAGALPSNHNRPNGVVNGTRH